VTYHFSAKIKISIPTEASVRFPALYNRQLAVTFDTIINSAAEEQTKSN
jgi:hypothetical protein